MGYRGLYLKIPGEHRLVASKELPFQEGLKLLIQRYQAHDDVFLPILVKGDLREYEARMPSLHLHRINPARLSAHPCSASTPSGCHCRPSDRPVPPAVRADVTPV